MLSDQQQGGRPASNFWDELPIFFKLLLIISLLSGVISVFTGLIAILFINIPYYTVFYVNLWRLFTASLISVGFLQSILGILVLYFIQPQIQKRISTVIISFDFFITNAFIQLFFCIVWIPFYFFNKQKNKIMYSAGLLPIWIVYLVRVCYSDQQGDIKICCLPINIKKKYYPVLILGLFGLMNWSIPYDLIIAALFTFIECKFFSGSIIKLQRSTFIGIESSFLFKCLINRTDFYSLNNSNDTKYFCKNQDTNRYQEFYSDLMNAQSAQNNNNNNQNVRPYNFGGEYNQALNDSGLSNMKGGVSLSAGIKPVITIEDVRNHWASKDNNIQEEEKEQAADEGVKVSKNKQTKAGYINFEDQN